MSMQQMKEISHRYVRHGESRDVDAFEAEMKRLEGKQRQEILERYIAEMYGELPYLVRDRHNQIVPVRHRRVLRLIEQAALEQAQRNAVLQAQNDILRQKLDSEEEKDATDAAAAKRTEALAAATIVPVEKKDAAVETPTFSTYLPYILGAIATLLILLLLALVYALWRLADFSRDTAVAKAGFQPNLPSETNNVN